MSDPFSDGNTLVFRMNEDGSLPSIPVRLDLSGHFQIIPAELRLDVRRSQIASQWAEALGLSAGAAALAQVATRLDDSAEQWGPCEYLTPEVSPALDSEIDDQTAVGGFWLGQDFLRSIVVTVLGPVQLVALSNDSD